MVRSDAPERPAGAPDATDTPVLEARNISKYFGPTTALVDVSLAARAGRILALLGDNGAGKSTLIKILSGVFPPDRGEMLFHGQPVRFRNPNEARARGIATCYQDLAVCELLSVSRNVVLGRDDPELATPDRRGVPLERARDRHDPRLGRRRAPARGARRRRRPQPLCVGGASTTALAGGTRRDRLRSERQECHRAGVGS